MYISSIYVLNVEHQNDSFESDIFTARFIFISFDFKAEHPKDTKNKI